MIGFKYNVPTRGWLRELLSVIKRCFHCAQNVIFSRGVRGVVIYGSETSESESESEEDFAKLEQNDWMLRWMCNVALKDRKSSGELRDLVDVGKHNHLHTKGQVYGLDMWKELSIAVG